MIEINIGASVESEGREIGRIERVILDRTSFEATHLVIRHGGALQSRQVLMPLGWVTHSEHDKVTTIHKEEEIVELPSFELKHYVGLDKFEQEQAEHPRSKIKPMDWVNYVVPLVANAFGDPLHTPGVLVTDQLVTPSESTIKRGLAVESSDGHKMGEVHEVLLSEPEWRLSGIIMARGFVLKHPMRLPGDWIAMIERERIVLNRTREQVETWEKQQA